MLIAEAASLLLLLFSKARRRRGRPMTSRSLVWALGAAVHVANAQTGEAYAVDDHATSTEAVLLNGADLDACGAEDG